MDAKQTCKKWLLDDCWKVKILKNDKKYSIFDLEAYKEGVFKFIKIENGSIKKEVRELVEKFNEEHHSPCTSYEVWCYKENEIEPTLLSFDELYHKIHGGN